MGKLDTLKQNIDQRIEKNFVNMQQLVIAVYKSSSSNQENNEISDLEAIEEELNFVEYAISNKNPLFKNFEQQNAILRVINQNLSDEISDELLFKKLLLLENFSAKEEGKIITIKHFLKDLGHKTFNTIPLELQTETNDIVKEIGVIQDQSFVNNLLYLYKKLHKIYDQRQNQRYRMTVEYDEKTIQTSTILRTYMETTKNPNYKDGSLIIDLQRDTKLQKQRKTSENSVFILTYPIAKDINFRKESDAAFDEDAYVFSKIKDITGEDSLSDKEAKKADVLNRFAHQMFEAEVINEFIHKFAIFHSSDNNKSRFKFFDSPKALSIRGVVGSTLKTDHRVYLDLDQNQNFVEVDFDIPVISVNDDYVCFDADKRNLKWVRQDDLNHPNELLKYKEPLVHLHAKAVLETIPNQNGQYYLKVIACDIQSFSPAIKPIINPPSHTIKVESKISQEALSMKQGQTQKTNTMK